VDTAKASDEVAASVTVDGERIAMQVRPAE
jgi:hypothetical protein